MFGLSSTERFFYLPQVTEQVLFYSPVVIMQHDQGMETQKSMDPLCKLSIHHPDNLVETNMCMYDV